MRRALMNLSHWRGVSSRQPPGPLGSSSLVVLIPLLKETRGGHKISCLEDFTLEWRWTHPLVGVVGIISWIVELGLTVTAAWSIWEGGTIAFVSTWRPETWIKWCTYYKMSQSFTWPLESPTSKSVWGAPISVHHATGVSGAAPGHSPAVVKRLSRLSKAGRGILRTSTWSHDLVLGLESNNWTEDVRQVKMCRHFSHAKWKLT